MSPCCVLQHSTTLRTAYRQYVICVSAVFGFHSYAALALEVEHTFWYSLGYDVLDHGC